MTVGDVYVTATFMLVLGATLIVGNIIADLLLGAARSARAPRSEGTEMSLTVEQLLDPRPTVASRARVPTACVEADIGRDRARPHRRTATKAIWRSSGGGFRRSLTGMIGLVLVSACC